MTVQSEGLVCLFLMSVAMATKLSLTNGGYEDITIAINKNVPKSMEMVEKLQILLQDASESLYAATGLYMRTATILVPSSWQIGDRNDKLTFSEADMRVDRPHPYYRDRPYTQPTWTCGTTQRYVHLTPWFVLGKTDRTKNIRPGIALANQFARYRWGVFDDVISDETGSTTMSRSHEKACKGKSVADIIQSHDDHSQKGQTPIETVTFTVVYNDNDQDKNPEEKECGRRVVLLLDDSMSMDEYSRVFRQKQVARNFIKDVLPASSEIGIITFHEYSIMLVRSLTKLSSDEDQAQIVDLVTQDRRLGAATGIGQALKDALALLKETSDTGISEEDRILLITDGEENPQGGPKIADVMKDIVESRVMVHSIALGRDASRSLGELCQATGGVYGYYTENAKSGTLTQVVSNLWQDFNMLCVEDQPIEIANIPLEVSKDKPVVEQPVPIDSTVNKTVFQFTSPENSDIELQIKDPENRTYDRNSPQYTEDLRLKVDKFTFDNPQEQTSETATTQKTVVAKKKKRSRKMEDALFQPSVKKPKKQQVKKAKVMDKNSSQPSLVTEPISPPPTEANLDVSSEVNLFVDEDTLVADCQSTTPNDWWQDYNQLMEDIEQQESNAVVDDPYEEHKLTPLQKNCSVCRHNNMLRYISCNSGQVRCHVCCMDLMNCMCYHDPEGMVDDMISQDFHGHILTV